MDLRYAELLSEGKKREALKSLKPMIEGGRIEKSFMKFFMGYVGPLLWSTTDSHQICWWKAKRKWRITPKAGLLKLRLPRW